MWLLMAGVAYWLIQVGAPSLVVLLVTLAAGLLYEQVCGA